MYLKCLYFSVAKWRFAGTDGSRTFTAAESGAFLLLTTAAIRNQLTEYSRTENVTRGAARGEWRLRTLSFCALWLEVEYLIFFCVLYLFLWL